MSPLLWLRARILVVDDQLSARLAVSRLLTDLGLEIVQTASSGAQAMLAIETAREPFDVVICDLIMPTEDGLVFLRRLAGLEMKPSVILVSGAEPAILESARRLGARFGVVVLGAIQKPVTADALAQFLGAGASARPPEVPVTSVILTGEAILDGLDAKRFELWFQPQIDIASGRVVGAEGLLRYRDEERGILSPPSFIKTAERAGLMGRLNTFVLNAAILQCAEWQARGWPLTVSVNLSPAGMHDVTLPDRVAARCLASHVAPDRIVFELTESSLGSDVTSVLDIAIRLRLGGCGLSIDDFGTGYGSLSELESMPFQELKLDVGLVQNAAHDARSLTILKNTIRLASELKMSVVAEGVETEAIFHMVAGLGCDRAQGYFIARPMPADEAEDWLVRYALDPLPPRTPEAVRAPETSLEPARGIEQVERFAHDAASPLMLLLVLSKALMDDTTPQDRQHLDDVRSIHEAASELSSMIDTLRAHAPVVSDVGPAIAKSDEPACAVSLDLDPVTLRAEEHVETYAGWVRNFRLGSATPALVTDASDPLAHLGRELEMLSATVSRRESELQKLIALGHHMETGVGLDDILDRIFEGFLGIIPFDRMGCAFLSDDCTRVVSYWARSELGPVRIGSGFERPMAGSSLEAIRITGRPRILNDLVEYLAAKPTSVSTRLIVEEGGRSSLTCPLFVDGRPLGFLFFTSRSSNSYHEAHKSIFLQITDQVASILNRSRLHERLITHNRTLLERTQRLEVVAAHDTLTGVLNRGAIEAVLESNRSLYNPDRRFGVIIADIDHFKAINDRFGHAVGDLALCEFVRRLSTVARKGDTIARLGGEEFLVVLNDITDDLLAEAAERYRWSVCDKPFVLAGHVVNVSASFGTALTAAREPIPDLIARADVALYAAKDLGRNRCETAGVPS